MKKFFKEVPKEERIKIVDKLFVIEKKAESGALSKEEFEEFLKELVEKGVIRVYSVERLKEIEEKAKKKHYSFYLIYSSKGRYYCAVVGELGKQSLRGQIIEKLIEISQLIKNKPEINAEEEQRRKKYRFLDQMIREYERGKMDEKIYRKVLEKAIKWNIIKETTKSKEELKRENIPYLVVKGIRGWKIYVFAGSPKSDFEKTFFNLLKGKFLKAKIVSGKKRRF